MTRQEVILPKMGESITDATLIAYTVSIGDQIKEDDTIAEVATDKVDSEVPSPIEGVVVDLLYKKNDVIPVGAPIIIIESSSKKEQETPRPIAATNKKHVSATPITSETKDVLPLKEEPNLYISHRLSPLVQNICKRERITTDELNSIVGSGRGNRITKKDVLRYIEHRQTDTTRLQISVVKPNDITSKQPSHTSALSDVTYEMDRMRKAIADHMVMSKHTSPHVSTFLEVDVTNMVKWRTKNKEQFALKHGTKLTYTPLFFKAVAQALVKHPAINASLNGSTVTIKKDINIGMAAALPTGNLIVPVIRNAETHNLIGLAKIINDLAERARSGSLKPDEVQGGTFTISNLGTFGNDYGTPIINQPQAAIIAIGAINKKPAVIETEEGDMIAIRSKMMLSLSFDHRIIDGFLGGSFLREVGNYIESFQMDNIQ